VAALLKSFADIPNSFRRDLAASGFTIIEPGDGTFDSFSLKHWHLASFLARKQCEIYVPLIHARNPRHGALSRLLIEIRQKDLSVAVVAPLGPLEAILGNWGFTPIRELICDSVEDVWRKPREASNV